MIESLFRNKVDNTFIQLFRYAFVGGFAFIIDFGSLYILTEFFGIHYLISAPIAFILGLITNYILSIVWVFKKRKFRNKSFEFGMFGLIGIVGVGLNELFIWYFTEYVHLYYLTSKIISTGFVFLWNFFVRKSMLFR